MALFRMSTALRTARAQAIADALATGAGDAQLNIYDGAMPETPETAITTQVLLAELPMPDPIGSVADGAFTISNIVADSSANADGTAAWARFFDGDGLAVADGDVTLMTGDGVVRLDDVNIVLAAPVSVSEGTITEGNA